MFYGEYQHTIDPKGRVIMPSKFREGLGEKFMVTKGLDSCLFVYSRDEWDNLEAKMRALPITSPEARILSRFVFAGAADCEVDKQGRILIPQHLREYAKLDKDVCITGVSNRVEIWDKATWDEYQRKLNDDPEIFEQKISLLGI